MIPARVVVGVFVASYFCSEISAAEIQRPKARLVAVGLCAVSVIGVLAINLRPRTTRLPVETPRTSQDLPATLGGEIDPPIAQAADVLDLYMARASELSTASEERRMDLQYHWIRGLAKAPCLTAEVLDRGMTQNPLVAEFKLALQEGDFNRAEFFRKVLETTDDWSVLDFFSQVEVLSDEPGHLRWVASLDLPQSSILWRVDYERRWDASGKSQEMESQLRIYRD